MKRTTHIILMLLLAFPLLMNAQEFPEGSFPNEHNLDGVQWPRVDAEGNTYFRVYAPFAKEVEISFRGPMTREDDGYWTYVSPEPETAHEWLTWRRSLREFAPLLFK